MELIKQYNSVNEKINLNKNLIKNTSNLMQSIYKRWFVEFNFPDNEWKEYRLNSGEFEFNKSLDAEIPKWWEVMKISEFCKNMSNWSTPLRNVREYWDKKEIPWLKSWEVHNCIIIDTEEYISQIWFENTSTKLLPINTVIIALYWVTAWEVWFLKCETTTNQACCWMVCNSIIEALYLYNFLLYNQKEISQLANWWAQDNLSKDIIENLKITVPPKEILDKFNLEWVIEFQFLKTKENYLLDKIRNLIFSKMSQL